MPTWVLIPVKSLTEGKRRLSPPLDPLARRELNEFFLRHMVESASSFTGRDRTAIISECADTLGIARALGAHAIKQSEVHGLNSAVTEGVEVLHAVGAEEVLVVACDLPLVRTDDLREVADQGGENRVVICPDKRWTGTNALLLPTRIRLRFSFGIESYAAHLREVRQVGAMPIEHFNWRIALDIDDSADLDAWKGKGRRLRKLDA